MTRGWCLSFVLFCALAAGGRAATYHVAPPPLGDDGNDGSSGTPWATIQHAITTVNGDGHTIRVAEGTYDEHVIFNTVDDKNITLEGGYESAGWTRDIAAHLTAINGGGSGTGVLVNAAATNCVISGFTISNCQYAVYGNAASPVLISIQALSNTSHGIALSSQQGATRSMLSNCVMRGNGGVGLAAWPGACGTCSPRLFNCVMTRNKTYGLQGSLDGGSVCTPVCSLELTDCEITLNGSRGVNNTGNRGTSISQFTRCLVASNASDGLYFSSSANVQLTVDHSVVAHNGGSYGIYVSAGAYPQLIENSIVWDNGASLSFNRPGYLSVLYSDIEGGCPAGAAKDEGNIDADPVFADAGGGDFHLQGSSPCINPWNGETEMGLYGKEVLVIDGGGKYTSDLDVELDLGDRAPGWDGAAVRMRLSNDGGTWDVRDFASPVSWDLSAFGGNSDYGWKTVYYQALDAGGNPLTGSPGAKVVGNRIEYMEKTVRIVPNDPAYVVIQEAINAAVSNDIVEVMASKTYVESVVIKGGVTLRAGEGFLPVIRSVSISSNTVRIASAAKCARVEGFIITGGAAGVSNGSDCVIRNNTMISNSIGLYCSSSAATIISNTMIQNSQYGIYCNQVSPALVDNHALSNTSHGIYIYQQQAGVRPVLSNCVMRGNGGAGLVAAPDNCGTCSPRLFNCVMTRNGTYGLLGNLEGGSVCAPV